jgi:hypothetical protein
MMHLGDERETAGRQALDIIQALDDDELPQGLGQIERARVKARDLDAELPPVAGLGQSDVADMVFDVEIGILDPVRMIHVQRQAYEALAEAARAAQPARDELENVLEAHEAAGRGRGIVDADRADVHRCVRRLEIDEARVLPAQLLHRSLPWLRPSCPKLDAPASAALNFTNSTVLGGSDVNLRQSCRDFSRSSSDRTRNSGQVQPQALEITCLSDRHDPTPQKTGAAAATGSEAASSNATGMRELPEPSISSAKACRTACASCLERTTTM